MIQFFSAGSPKDSAAGERIRPLSVQSFQNVCRKNYYLTAKTATEVGNTIMRVGVAAVSNFAAHG
jgi:hypothetical protein